MFFDVFPTLEVNGDMKKLLSETEVTKVGMNPYLFKWNTSYP